MQTIYFHGMPGSPAELGLFPGIDTPSWRAPNRGALLRQATQPERFDLLAEMVGEQCRMGPVRLIGFSLGAYVALETARRLPEAPLQLDLVSAAAPLALGDFLEGMAGRTLFAMARDHRHGFAALAQMQSLAAAAMPGRLTNALFATAQGSDLALRSDAHFRRGMGNMLRQCLREGLANYLSEITAYVGPWAQILPAIRHPVTLWHGDRDNWAPAAMALAIAGTLPNVTDTHILPGLSHYSCLRAALRSIAGRP